MSVEMTQRVWAHSKAKGSTLLLLLAIADFPHSSENPLPFPSRRLLAEKVRVTERQLKNLVAEAVALGELQVLKNSGPHGTNFYKITLPGMAEGGKYISPLKGRKKGGNTVPPGGNPLPEGGNSISPQGGSTFPLGGEVHFPLYSIDTVIDTEEIRSKTRDPSIHNQDYSRSEQTRAREGDEMKRALSPQAERQLAEQRAREQQAKESRANALLLAEAIAWAESNGITPEQQKDLGPEALVSRYRFSRDGWE